MKGDVDAIKVIISAIIISIIAFVLITFALKGTSRFGLAITCEKQEYCKEKEQCLNEGGKATSYACKNEQAGIVCCIPNG